jgi:hypothetical protein
LNRKPLNPTDDWYELANWLINRCYGPDFHAGTARTMAKRILERAGWDRERAFLVAARWMRRHKEE